MINQNLFAALICFISSFSYSQFSASYRLTHDQVQQDMNILYKSISEGVIEIYWYKDQSEFQSEFDSICNLQNGMPYIEFYREVTRMVSSMGCVHSYVQESPMDDYFSENHDFIPIGVNNTNSETLISFSVGNEIPLGSKLLEINGKTIDQIRSQMFTIYGTDGQITSIPKYGTQNEDFSYFYKHYVDTSQNFKVKFQYPSGKQEVKILQGVDWNIISNMPDFEKVKFTEYPYALNIENKIAILNIESSSRSEYNERKWAKFLDQCFEKIENEKIDHLIIDVRRNSGGWMPHMFHLVEYFARSRFVPVTEAWQKNDNYSFMKYSSTPKRDFINNKNRDLDSLIGVAQYDNWLINVEYVPKKEHFFNGQVYILAGGETHSAASRFISAAREYSNPIIIGDYPGGCYIGGSGGNSATVVLPNSQISVNIALTFFKPGWFDIRQKGSAVKPDHFIEQEIGNDAAMQFSINLINQSLTKPKLH